MNEATAGLVRQLRQAIKRSAEGYPLQITFEPFQLEQLGEILDLAEQRAEESDLWRRVEALAKKVMRERGPNNPYCCCECFEASGMLLPQQMIVCPTCGNKRCPKADSHRYMCTGSNEPGQVGKLPPAEPGRPEGNVLNAPEIT